MPSQQVILPHIPPDADGTFDSHYYAKAAADALLAAKANQSDLGAKADQTALDTTNANVTALTPAANEVVAGLAKKLALGSGQYPKGDGTNVVPGDFATDVAATAAVKRVDPGTALTEGQIIQGATGGGPESVLHRSHTAVVVAPPDAPAHMRKIADFEGTAVGIQAAVDQAQTYLPSNGSLPGQPIHFLPGVYSITAEIEVRSASWICPGGAAAGAQLIWDGAAGGTMLTKGPEVGTASWWGLNGFSFDEGANVPAAHLSFGSNFVDSHCVLENCAFAGAERQIVLPSGFVNVAWHHLRFDRWHEYAIYVTIPAYQFITRFTLDQFTYDNNSNTFGAATAVAFMGVQLTDGGVDPGIITLSNARFETNEPFVGTPNSIVHIIQDGISAQSPVVYFTKITNSYTEGMSPVPQAFVYRDPTATGGADRVLLDNVVSQNATTKLVAGRAEIGSFSAVPVAPTFCARASIGLGEVVDVQDGGYPRDYRGYGGGSVVERGFNTAPPGNVVIGERTVNNTFRAGADSTAVDTEWGRTAANTFGTADDDSIKAGSGAWNAGHLLLGAYHLWVDAAGSLRIASGAPGSDTAGTVVGAQT